MEEREEGAKATLDSAGRPSPHVLQINVNPIESELSPKFHKAVVQRLIRS